MKKRELRYSLSITGLALCLAFGVAAQAQNKEKYIISAKAGGVNLVSGNVMVERSGGKTAQALSSNDNLENGDKVITGADGRLEVLLNPGSYLRADENTEFELTDASLDNLHVKLLKGRIIVEASSADGVVLSIAIKTPQTDALIVKGGLYRFNILADGTTEIVVHKGMVLYGPGQQEQAKGGQKVLIGHGLTQVAKLSKKDMDALDLWSKQRAEFLAKANRQLQPRTLMTAFNNYYWDNWGSLAWSNPTRLHNGGYWVYDPNLGRHCFLPGDGRQWTSPYGHHYWTGVGSNGNGQGWTRGNGGGSGSWGNGNSSGGRGGGDSSSGRGNSSSGGGSNGWNGGNSAPVSQPTMSEPSIPRAAESHIERAQGDGKSPNK